MTDRYFSTDTLSFLQQLASNNNRDWFEENRANYEATVRGPALQFITDMADDLAAISPHFLAQPRKVGGSLMRVHRDVRFARDKRPYKLNIGIQFRHEVGKDVHAPGFYLHIEPNEFFIGVGVWHPDSAALGKIRDVIVEHPERWQSAIDDKAFKRHFTLGGGALSRAPRGYDKDHPLLEDLKRKDFIGFAALDKEQVIGPRLRKLVTDRFRAADSFMAFLCKSLELRY